MQLDISKDPLIKSLVEAVNALLDAENERRFKSIEPLLPPVINITMPEMLPAQVTVNVDPTPVTINVPKQDAPNITVQPAPVTIQKPAKKPSNFVVQRNKDGNITGIEEK